MPVTRAPRDPRQVLAGVLTWLVASAAFAGQLPVSAGVPAVAPPLDYSRRAWTVSDGLPQGSISDIARTPDGYIWFATFGGLVRFDGLRFTIFDAVTFPALASNQVLALAPAREGGLWISANGAHVFRAEGRREVQHLPPAPDGRSVRWMAVAQDGTLWASTTDLILKQSAGGWSSFPLPGGRRAPVRALTVDTDGAAWAGAGGGLVRIDGTRATVVDIAGIGTEDYVAALLVDQQGRLWMGGTAGLFRSDRSRSVYSRVAGVEGRVTALAASPSGDVWVATISGVYVFAGGSTLDAPTVRLVATTEAPGGSPLVRLLSTPAGTIVGGTADAGFLVFTPRPFELFGVASGLANVRVHHVLSDGTGGLWVGAACAGLARFSHPHTPGTTVFLPPQLGLEHPCVRGLLRDRRGNLWVGQSAGNLTRIGADGSTRSWTRNDGLPEGDIGPLLEGRDGRLWVGGGRGVLSVVSPDGRLSRATANFADATQAIWSLAEDEAGRIWLGQVGRVSRQDAGGVKTWTTADGIPPFPIRVLRPAGNETVWLGTYGGGLARLRDGRVVSITTRSGLFDNAVSAWIEDGRGGLWLLGNRGVFATRRDDVDAVADGRLALLDGALFGPGDGVPEGNGGHPAGALLPDGHIAFATVQGLAVFEPDALPSLPPPIPVIEDVIGARRDDVGDDEFIVPAGGGPVEVRFSAPAVGSAGGVRVRYQLAGHDRTWIEAGTERRAVYSGLAPGHYRFHLSSRRVAGPWAEHASTLALVVLPFWWQTWWARLLMVGGLALGVAGAVRVRLRTLDRRNAALAKEIRERVRAEEQAHRHLLALAHVGRLATAGELTASLAHDLGQPLTAIVANAEASKMLLAVSQPDLERVQDTLSSISQQGRRASDVIRGLRRFLGRGTPDISPVDINETVREVMALLHSTLLADRIRLDLRLAESLPLVPGDRVPLQQVLMNLALNAVEAMREVPDERRCLVVRAKATRRGVKVCVADGGPGIEGGFARKMFEPFQTTKPEGMGMGLAICRSIVEAHGGTIHARHRFGGGTAVCFSLPSVSPSED